jgi:hypothetical protein
MIKKISIAIAGFTIIAPVFAHPVVSEGTADSFNWAAHTPREIIYFADADAPDSGPVAPGSDMDIIPDLCRMINGGAVIICRPW